MYVEIHWELLDGNASGQIRESTPYLKYIIIQLRLKQNKITPVRADAHMQESMGEGGICADAALLGGVCADAALLGEECEDAAMPWGEVCADAAMQILSHTCIRT